MTYFEWVSTFEKLKTAPMDYSLLKQLEDKKINGGQYVLYSLVAHVSDTVNTRLNNRYMELFMKILNDSIDIDTLSLELINYKKEVKFLNKIIELPIIPNDSKEKFRTTLDTALDDIYNALKRNIEYIDVDGQYISTFEKIMNSDMEE